MKGFTIPSLFVYIFYIYIYIYICGVCVNFFLFISLTYCGNERSGEGIVREAEQYASLADAGVTDKQ